jgi:hypothetical protein
MVVVVEGEEREGVRGVFVRQVVVDGKGGES